MDIDLKIEFISTEQTFPLRRSVLEPNPSNTFVKLENDDAPSSFHLGAIYDQEIIGIVTFHKIRHELFEEDSQYQLRKMAISSEFRNLHSGKKLIAFGIDYLQNTGVRLVWCNARSAAVGFYEKLGFVPVGDFFDIPSIGLHKLMYRKLAVRK